jgi:Predicted membrane protein
MANWTRLENLSRGTDAVLLGLRLYLGGFLIWGVWDNIVSTARMAEFQGFLASLNCPMPALAAPVSVWAQFVIGVLLIPGLLTRWAGLLLVANFLVAVWLLLTGLEASDEAVAREIFGPMMCVMSGLVLATQGAGRLSVDAFLDARRR